VNRSRVANITFREKQVFSNYLLAERHLEEVILGARREKSVIDSPQYTPLNTPGD